MDVDLLSEVQAATFLAAAVAIAVTWWRQRSRPAAYASGAFIALAIITVPGSTLVPLELSTDVAIVVLSAFTWLIVAFAWSFTGPLPRWCWAALAVVVSLAVWGTSLDLGGDTETPTTFLVTFLTVWTGLSVAAATHLIRAGGGYPLVRSRMRTLACGVLVLTAALLLAGFAPEEGVASQVLALLVWASALLFLLGTAPPPSLRMWWRRHATSEFEAMQTELIGAQTPEEVAEVAVPRMATILGSGVALVDRDGHPLATSDLDAGELAAALVGRGPARVLDLDHSRLVVHRSPYTPVFGRDEEQLIGVLALQVRMAYERAELHAATVRGREELEAMLLGLSHDLRNPAVSIMGFSDLLLEDPPDRLEMVQHVRSSAAYLHQLIDALLELSEVGRSRPDPEPVDLVDVAREVAARATAAHPGVQVEVTGSPPVVVFSRVRAAQLLENLVSNAVKHGGRPDLTVSIDLASGGEARGEDGVALTVSDDGVGIDEADRDRVFALFQRGRTAASGGNGLGLGMVRRIAQSEGGEVRLEPSDVGARFVVDLPVPCEPRVATVG